MAWRNARGRMLPWSLAERREIADVEDLRARLLFYVLWAAADNVGRAPGDPDLLASALFPRDAEVNADLVEKWLADLRDASLIRWYAHDGDWFVELQGFATEQRLEKRQQGVSTYPAPPSEENNKGREEKRRGPTRCNTLQHVPTKAAKKPYTDAERAATSEAISYLNQRAGSGFKTDADVNLELVTRLLRGGATLGELKSVIDAKTKEWGSDPTMQGFLRPSTLFGCNNFWSKYHGAAAGSSSLSQTSLPPA